MLTVSAKPNSAPASAPVRADDDANSIAGTVLPIARAEELLGTLPGVMNVRIITGEKGEVTEVHLLTTTEVSPKQTVRNVESALMAELGLRVSHKKISVATSEGAAADAIRAARVTSPEGSMSTPTQAAAVYAEPAPVRSTKRRLYFEDVEVRRSRASGMSCRVTIRQGEALFVGEASGLAAHDRMRLSWAVLAVVQLGVAVALLGVGRVDPEASP